MKRTRSNVGTLAATVFLAAGRSQASAQPAPSAPQVAMPAGLDRLAVLMALTGAQKKLADASCRSLLTDFRDVRGQTLLDNLNERGLDPAGYLASLRIEGRDDGDGALCRTSRAVALTRHLGQVIHVCNPRFTLQTRGGRENVLIHEMLHTLGLGEAPPMKGQPTGHDIDQQVRRRCGN